MEALHYFLNNLTFMAWWFGIHMVLFAVLERVFPCNPEQKRSKTSYITDLGFHFILLPLYTPIHLFLQSYFLAFLISSFASDILFEGGSSIFYFLPIAVQFIIIVALVDFLQYWTHRFSHTKSIWKYHAIHHSSKQLDWLSASRWHPINALFHNTLTMAMVFSLDFHPEALMYVFLFHNTGALLVHSNLNWTYGPLKYVFVSPVLHRWHHTGPDEGGEKNFAPYLSIYDVMFGTFYFPEDKRPATYGVDDPTMPDGFFGQLAYPFRRPKKQREETSTPASPDAKTENAAH